MNKQHPYKDGVGHRPAFDYTPERDAPGEAIDWVRSHTQQEIIREEQASMNCAVTTDLIEVCNYIGEVEKLNSNRVYIALCVRGRDRCYHEMKVNRGDVFTDIEKQVSRGKRAIHSPSKRAMARQGMVIFNDVASKKFNTDKQTLGIAVDEAKKSGVKTSHLNLYWCMTGLKYFIDDEPSYRVYQYEPLFVDALHPLIRADTILEERRDMLNVWMGV